MAASEKIASRHAAAAAIVIAAFSKELFTGSVVVVEVKLLLADAAWTLLCNQALDNNDAELLELISLDFKDDKSEKFNGTEEDTKLNGFNALNNNAELELTPKLFNKLELDTALVECNESTLDGDDCAWLFWEGLTLWFNSFCSVVQFISLEDDDFLTLTNVLYSVILTFFPSTMHIRFGRGLK